MQFSARGTQESEEVCFPNTLWTCPSIWCACPMRHQAAPFVSGGTSLRISAPAAVSVGALRAQMPPNDPPMLPLCNPGVARVRSSSFYRWSSARKWGPGRPKRSRFHLDLRMRHPLSRFYTWVMVRTNAGAWGLADNSCLFRSCANFPDLTRGVGAGPLLALGRRHSGAPAYQNW